MNSQLRYPEAKVEFQELLYKLEKKLDKCLKLVIMII